MKTRFLQYVAVLAFSGAFNPPAEACEIAWTPVGLTANNCTSEWLRHNLEGGEPIDFEDADWPMIPPEILALPDLVPIDVDVQHYGGYVRIVGSVVNDSIKDVPQDFIVKAYLRIIDPDRMLALHMEESVRTINGLDAGEEQSVELWDFIQLEPTTRDWHVEIYFSVDLSQASDMWPSDGGKIRESDEHNTRFSLCRIIGPDSDGGSDANSPRICK